MTLSWSRSARRALCLSVLATTSTTSIAFAYTSRARGLSSMTHKASRNDNYGGAGVTLNPIGGPPQSSIVWMHGLGDSGEGWSGAFNPAQFPTTRLIFPTAPTRPISLNGGFPMPGWFDINGLDESSPEDKAGFEEAKKRIEGIVAGEMAAGVPAEKIILGGFSQGGAVTLHVALRSKIKVGGAVVLSGWLPLKADYPAALTEAGKSMTYFHGHGDADGVVRYQWGQHSAEKLKELGLDYTFKTYRGLDHGATPEEMKDAAAFMKAILDK
jgi:lysophospholipase-2